MDVWVITRKELAADAAATHRNTFCIGATWISDEYEKEYESLLALGPHPKLAEVEKISKGLTHNRCLGCDRSYSDWTLHIEVEGDVQTQLCMDCLAHAITEGLNPEERMELLRKFTFCLHCGRDLHEYGCFCMDDE